MFSHPPLGLNISAADATQRRKTTISTARRAIVMVAVPPEKGLERWCENLGANGQRPMTYEGPQRATGLVGTCRDVHGIYRDGKREDGSNHPHGKRPVDASPPCAVGATVAYQDQEGYSEQKLGDAGTVVKFGIPEERHCGRLLRSRTAFAFERFSGMKYWRGGEKQWSGLGGREKTTCPEFRGLQQGKCPQGFPVSF